MIIYYIQSIGSGIGDEIFTHFTNILDLLPNQFMENKSNVNFLRLYG